MHFFFSFCPLAAATITVIISRVDGRGTSMIIIRNDEIGGLMKSLNTCWFMNKRLTGINLNLHEDVS